MDKETKENFAKCRLQRAKETIESAKLLYNSKDYIGANNRAYYAIFYAIRAILALEEVDFKRHKDVIAYFKKNYIKTEIFPRILGTKISQAQVMREDSDYDDNYEPSSEKTQQQLETAKDVIQKVEEYIESHI